MIRLLDEMITAFRLFCHTFVHRMTKTKYQESAMKYAKDYLERLLQMEDMVGRNVEKRLGQKAERNGKQYPKREHDKNK